MMGRAWVIGGLAALVACSKPPQPEPAAQGGPAAEVPASVEDARPPPPPLSDEDIRLIEADPTTLTPEERRKRAYALRRKIMQNPDSPAARTLEDLAKAARDGSIEVDQSGQGVTFHQSGPKAPPAGVRPDDPSP
jgi:hypothetical protein